MEEKTMTNSFDVTIGSDDFAEVCKLSRYTCFSKAGKYHRKKKRISISKEHECPRN